MKLFALLPLLFVISCQDTLGDRDLIDDTVVAPGNSDSEIPGGTTGGGGGGVPVATKLHSRCQSTTRCFFARLPVYQQDNDGLESYIGNKIGISNYRDPGLCAPTSATMALRAVLDERSSYTRLNNAFLESIPSRSWYETVYQVGTDSYTDFRNGGAYTTSIFYAFQNYFQRTVAYKGLYLTMEHSWTQNSNLSNTDVINLFKSKKPALYIGVDALKKKETYINGQKKIWHEANGQGHALVIKGFDGDRLHIQDPWGMDHFARIKHESFATYSYGSAHVNGVFTDVTTSSGFMSYYGANQKIVLDEVIALGLD